MIRKIAYAVVASASAASAASAVPFAGIAQRAEAPLPEASGNAIDHATVGEALAAVRSDTGVTITVEDGWTIAEDAPHRTIWSFAPPGHPAWPSVVKRSVVERGGATFVDTRMLCEASKAVCDALAVQFDAMNRRRR